MPRKQYVVMHANSVLIKPVGGQLNLLGESLFRALSFRFEVIVASDDPNVQEFRTWLEFEGVRPGQVRHIDNKYSAVANRWVRFAQTLRQEGYDVPLYVLADPHGSAELVRHGFGALTFSQPAYALPEWHPSHDKGIKPWDELTAVVESERRERMEDARMEQVEF